MIHTFNKAGMNLVLDTGSGAVHVVDDIAYELLQVLSAEEITSGTISDNLNGLRAKHGEETIYATVKELQQLVADGLLYADDSYLEFKNMLGVAPTKAMCLHLAHDCNLRCQYCFASTGGFGGQRKLMEFDTAKQAIDLLVELSEGRKNLEVDFFGGEPMLNFDVLKKTVEYARGLEKEKGKNFRFTVTTNGLTLNEENIEYINREMSNVVLSIDGRKEVNDRLRVRIDGTGSYDSIVPKMQQLVQGRGTKEYYVRGTYTRYNLDFDKDVLQLFDLGFDQISVEPVVGPETDDYAIQEGDIPAIEQSYERLMDELVERRANKKDNFNFFHFMLDLENGPCAIKRLKGCGSGNEYVAVTPDGEIYPCHQFVGNPQFIMGDVKNGLTKPELKQEFADANLFNKPECQTCWAKFFCSGGCNANNYTFSNSMLKPHKLSCELEKTRLECAIGLQAAMAGAKESKQ